LTVARLNRERLVQLLDGFVASTAGERANAAGLADSLVRRAGLKWSDVVRELDDDTVDALGRIERYRQDARRLEGELEIARREAQTLAEQLKGARETIEQERSAWAKERERTDAEQTSGAPPEVRLSRDLANKDERAGIWMGWGRTDRLVLVLLLAAVLALPFVLDATRHVTAAVPGASGRHLVHCKLRNFTDPVITTETSCLTNGGYVTSRD
jgi:hypothetical protein